MSSNRDTADAALALRRWAASCLWESHAGSPPAASREAWTLFLKLERCAAVLREQLQAMGHSAALPPADAAILSDAAGREVLYALSARANLRLLADISERHNWQPIVLKGGVAAAAGQGVPLADIDVWAGEDVGPRLWSALAEAGFATRSDERGHHLPARFQPAGIPIEVHHRIRRDLLSVEEMSHFSAPLAGAEPLRRLLPAEHAWLLLCESVIAHPERRYRLRDLRLIRDAMAACDAEGRERLMGRIRTSGFEEAFEQVIRSSIDPVSVSNGYRRFYLLSARSPRFHGRLFRSIRTRASAIAVEGIRPSWRRTGSADAADRFPLPLRLGFHAAAAALALVAARE